MMKRIATALVLGVLLSLSAPAAAQADDQERVKALLDKLDDLMRANSSHTVMTMKVKTEHYERSMTLEGWSQGKDKSLVRILKPRKESGTATLMTDKTIYTYLPKTDRTIRISSAMMNGAWMGSHITNDDLVKSSRMADDYTFKISFEGEREGQKVIEITLVPKADAAVMWGKVVIEVRAEDSIPLNYKFYEEDGPLVRTMSFTDVKTFSGRKMPARFKVVPADAPGEYTEIFYDKAEFDVSLSAKFFSLNNLKRD
jgi:outer membrane lipoprotein-sorting protein